MHTVMDTGSSSSITSLGNQFLLFPSYDAPYSFRGRTQPRFSPLDYFAATGSEKDI